MLFISTLLTKYLLEPPNRRFFFLISFVCFVRFFFIICFCECTGHSSATSASIVVPVALFGISITFFYFFSSSSNYGPSRTPSFSPKVIEKFSANRQTHNEKADALLRDLINRTSEQSRDLFNNRTCDGTRLLFTLDEFPQSISNLIREFHLEERIALMGGPEQVWNLLYQHTILTSYYNDWLCWLSRSEHLRHDLDTSDSADVASIILYAQATYDSFLQNPTMNTYRDCYSSISQGNQLLGEFFINFD